MTTEPVPIDLDTLLEGAIDTYQHQRQQEWHQDENGAAYLALFDAIAKWMLRSSQDLVARSVASGLDWGTAVPLLDIPGLRTPIEEKVQIDVAWQFATGTDGMAARCLELARLVLATDEGRLRSCGRLRRALLYAETN